MTAPRVGESLKRKEYRQLTRKELNIFHRALKKMKRNGEYDRIVNQHSFLLSRAAHFGVAFLPWHREYLDIFEQAVRSQGRKFCNFTIPYWDSALDQGLPVSADSVLWTPSFFGTKEGRVTEGNLGKNWKVTKSCRRFGKHLTRAVTGDPAFLYSRAKLNLHLAKKSLTELMMITGNMPYSKFEIDHGVVHCYVGECIRGRCTGHIACVECSPNDPIFWLLHSFVDSFWQEWAELPYTDNSYPVPGQEEATIVNLGGFRHLAYAPMSPFPNLTNIDGLKSGYPGYEERPSKIICDVDADCLSDLRLLFCLNCQCVSKIRRGGVCTGMPHRACYCEKQSEIPLCTDEGCLCVRF